MPSAACLLPLEILQRIYKRLDPVDFDAARSPSSFLFSQFHGQNASRRGSKPGLNAETGLSPRNEDPDETLKWHCSHDFSIVFP